MDWKCGSGGRAPANKLEALSSNSSPTEKGWGGRGRKKVFRSMGVNTRRNSYKK
jgi:hypothetical protein